MAKTAQKLHHQFGHPTAAKLKTLIKNAGVANKELEKAVDKYSDSCDTCRRFKKPTPRPIVSLPMATKFNETLAMDLKVYGSCYFLVFVDLATRYCGASIINNKRPSTIIKCLFIHWISLFGPPKQILSDNGCEFNNGEMREMGEAFNIKILTTSAESPWSNGVCERLNGVLGDSVDKIVHDTACDLSVALAWAVSARNALSNSLGFSPNQLVFGFNPVFPNIYSNKPPANESPSVSKMVIDNLSAMQCAREEFLKKESSERLKRAMRHNVRSTNVDDLQNGDAVYYKRGDSKEWRGPGVVIGRDGKQVLVKHGGIYVRVHMCRLVHVPETQEPVVGPQSENVARANNNSNDESDEDPFIEDTDDESGVPAPEQPPTVTTPEAEIVESRPENDVPSSSNCRTNVFKIGQRVSGIHTASGQLVTGKIVSRAGKATGKLKNCYNILKDSDHNVQWYDVVKDFDELNVVPDEAEMLVLFNSESVMSAKEREMESWIENGVYEEVENNGQAAISVRWVVTEKYKGGQLITKARLVARGFEEETSNMRKDSPTCSKEAVRLVLALSSTKGWECHSLDVKAAYLQGNSINREVFLMPPPEYYNGKLWRLRKTVYGLCDAARAWYLRVKEELLKLGATACSLDSALFSFKSEDKLEGVVCVYVDDFLWTGTKRFETSVIKKLSNLFLIGSVESGAFKYVGLNIQYQSQGHGLSVDQIQYASSLEPVSVSRKRANEKSSDLSEEERAEYRSTVGQLNWIATQTRPDIAFDVCELSVSYPCATVGDLLRLNKVIQRIQSDNVKLRFRKMESLDECHLECYSDASFANLPGGGSQGGFIILLRDPVGSRCPIYWQTRKIRRVVKSTLAAEALALLDCAEAAVYVAAVMSELAHCVSKVKIHCYIDNKSLLDALYSSKRVDDRRLRLDLAVLQDMLEKKELTSISWVSTSAQLADCLTKKGASSVSLRDAICA